MCRNTGISARVCVVIASLAMIGGLAPPVIASGRSLVASWDVSHSDVSRSLLEAPADGPAQITEELANACDLPGSLDAFFSQGGQGEVCQLAASVIGRGTQRFYTFDVPLNLTNLSFQVSLKNLEGEAIVYVSSQAPTLCHFQLRIFWLTSINVCTDLIYDGVQVCRVRYRRWWMGRG